METSTVKTYYRVEYRFILSDDETYEGTIDADSGVQAKSIIFLIKSLKSLPYCLLPPILKQLHLPELLDVQAAIIDIITYQMEEKKKLADTQRV